MRKVWMNCVRGVLTHPIHINAIFATYSENGCMIKPQPSEITVITLKRKIVFRAFTKSLNFEYSLSGIKLKEISIIKQCLYIIQENTIQLVNFPPQTVSVHYFVGFT